MRHDSAKIGDKGTKDSDNQGYFLDMTNLPAKLVDWMEENSNDLVVVWDLDGIIRFVSRSVRNFLGYSMEELLGTYWYEKLIPEDISYLETHLSKNSNHPNQIFNISIRNKLGKNIWAECTASKIIDEETKTEFFISSLRDITDKKEVEELMVRSEKMSIAGQLAAGIAHEIRNPLTSLKGFLQLLQAGVNRKEEYYKIMIDEIEKMETITSELLFISKPMTDNKKNESVKEMVKDVVELLKPQAKLKNISIYWEQKEDLFIHCDRSQLKQVLINLVKNAIEAMEQTGQININVYTENKQIIIDIIDEGPGIPEEIIHKLGEPFFTTKQTGTGLGLMITKQILERHDATLNILQNEGVGSTFRIELGESLN